MRWISSVPRSGTGGPAPARSVHSLATGACRRLPTGRAARRRRCGGRSPRPKKETRAIRTMRGYSSSTATSSMSAPDAHAAGAAFSPGTRARRKRPPPAPRVDGAPPGLRPCRGAHGGPVAHTPVTILDVAVVDDAPQAHLTATARAAFRIRARANPPTALGATCRARRARSRVRASSSAQSLPASAPPPSPSVPRRPSVSECRRERVRHLPGEFCFYRTANGATTPWCRPTVNPSKH